MAVKEITTLEDIEPWADQWNQLVDFQPMRTTWWFGNWWRHFGQAPQRQLSVWLCEVDGELLGVAPLYRTKFGSRQVYRFLGDGLACTDHTTWFAKPQFEDLVASEFSGQLSKSKWSRLRLESVDTKDTMISRVLTSLEVDHHCVTHLKPTDSCWSIELPDSWDEYLAILSKNHRKRCRRWYRQFFETGKASVLEADATNIDEVWTSFLDLHRQRWGTSQRPDGSFSDRDFAGFHAAVSRELLSQGQLRLCCLQLEGEPIAAEYQFMNNDTLYAYQSGVSSEHAAIGPGNLSILATIRYCIDNGIKRIDLMRGDEPYKRHWKAESSDCHHVSSWPAGFTGRVEFGIQRLRGVASDWLDSLNSLSS